MANSWMSLEDSELGVGLLEDGLLKLEEGYAALLKRTKSLQPDLPNVEITYKDLTCQVQVQQAKFHTVASKLASSLQFWKKGETKPLNILNSVSGVLKPGSMTLILAPPGHGKSSLLRAMSGKIKPSSGQVWFNGETQEEAMSRGVRIDKLCHYVDQVDTHFPFLTVRETLKFAYENSCVDSSLLGHKALQKAADHKVDTVIKLLGLEKCANTIIGNMAVRGVSGGEKKRVNIGEAMVTNARALFLDEVSSGLDSTTTIDIFTALREWASIQSGIVVTALLQPPPEVFKLFDKVILLRDGCVVYDGPREMAVPYIESSFGLMCPEGRAEPDFLVEFISTPQAVYERQVRLQSLSHRDKDGHRDLKTDAFSTANSPNLSTEGLVSYFEKSPFFSDSLMGQFKYRAEGGVVLENEFSQAQYGQEFAHSTWTHTKLCVERQSILNQRAKKLLLPRVIRVLLTNAILATLFYHFNLAITNLRLGLLFYFCMITSFNNLSELPTAFEAKKIVFKQRSQSMYSLFSYVLSVTLMSVPFLMFEVAVASNMVYWMTGFAPYATNFFIFFGILFVLALCMSTGFRMISYYVSALPLADMLATIGVWVCALFGGFLITQHKIPEVFVAFYWMSPFAWFIRALAINEYLSGQYTTLAGLDALQEWEISTGSLFVWAGALALVGYCFLNMVVSSVLLKYINHDFCRGTKRPQEGDEPVEVSNAHPVHSAVLSFKPATLVWNDLKYSVPIEGKTEPRQLLAGVSGFCKPGTMTALMGATGAGKTTLLDVLAGRKTDGSITGTIAVNGHPKGANFTRISAYVEQTDLHCATATVRESLLFSMALRQNQKLPREKRDAFIDNLLSILELTAEKDRLIGNGEISGLSPHQLRRVSVGVELTSNPSILFLDEPTTGLDSRSAFVMMHAVRNVAATGRSVICTIHQPSPELFFMFDNLLLLNFGGKQVYFGPLGPNAVDMVNYFESIPGTRPLPPLSNPATWMLSVIGSGTGIRTANSGDAAPIDYTEQFRVSELRQRNHMEIEDLCKPTEEEDRSMDKPSLWTQYTQVQTRVFRSYWRNIPFNFPRLVASIGIGLFLGMVYFNIDDSDEAGTNSKLSLVLVASTFHCLLQQNLNLPVYMQERPLFYREKAANMYASVIYTITNSVAEIPYLALATMLCVPVFYFMAGLKMSAEYFFMYCLAHFMLAYSFSATGQLLAAAMPTAEMAAIISGMYFSLSVLFSGIFIPGPDIPLGYRWMFAIDPIRQALEALIMPQFYCEGTSCPDLLINGVRESQAEYVSNYLGFSYGNYWNALAWLLLIIGVVKVGTALAHRFLVHTRR